MNKLEASNEVATHRMFHEIYQDQLLNTAGNATSKIVESLHLNDEDWLKIYERIVNVLNEILDSPDFKNYN